MRVLVSDASLERKKVGAGNTRYFPTERLVLIKCSAQLRFGCFFSTFETSLSSLLPTTICTLAPRLSQPYIEGIFHVTGTTTTLLRETES